MTFELLKTHVRAARFGSETGLSEGTLTIDRASLVAQLRAAVPEVARLELHLARPGDATRIVCVKDVVEPRCDLFPGPEGQRRQRALSGFAVATCGQIVAFQEGVVDMSGPGAAYTPFSALTLLVLEADVHEGCAGHEHEAALRALGLAAAAALAHAAQGAPTDEREVFALPEVDSVLPRVGYLYLLLSQGLLHDTWVEGRNAQAGLPRLVDPTLALSGGIVSGNCVSACDKNTTWHHQNNAVLRGLFRRHGLDLAFVGCVLSNEPTRLAAKEESAEQATRLLATLGPTGVVISKEGFGNPDADLMMLIRRLEAGGIRTVAITDEFAGIDGASQSLADTTAEADAVVSTGNANERVRLPPMERILGPVASVPRLAGASPESVGTDGSVELELQALLGSTNQIGHGRLTAREA